MSLNFYPQIKILCLNTGVMCFLGLLGAQPFWAAALCVGEVVSMAVPSASPRGSVLLPPACVDAGIEVTHS